MPLFTASSQLLPAIACTGLEPSEVVGSGAAQPIVYLLDRAGAGFHYRYEWEEVGPFSTDLLNDLADLEPVDYENCEDAEQHVQDAAERIRPLLKPPAALGPSQAVWLQLLVTVDALYARPRMNGENGKAYVEQHVDQQLIAEAQRRLRAVFGDAD